MEELGGGIPPQEKMKGKVLIIAYCFPPMQVIGSQRPYGLAKYLKHFGWDPTVLTIRHAGNFPRGIRVLPTEYSDRIASIKRLAGFNPAAGVHQQMGIPVTKHFSYPALRSKAIKAFRELVAFPDEEIGWYGHAVETASRLMDEEKIDAIISTSFPVTSHLVAKKLKQKYGVPWIADLRDLWTQNHYYGKFEAVRFLERRLELKTLSCADALVTISQPLADALKGLHAGKDVRCITNGFDPDDFKGAPSNLTEKFSITHTGRLYNGRRDPSMLLEATARLISENRIDSTDMEIAFYGPSEEWLTADINKYGLKDIVKVRGSVPRQEAIWKQKESQLLLLLLWNDERERGVYTGKLFEYLGARRPILAIGGANSIVKDLLADTGSGRLAEDSRQLETILMQYYREFKSSGEVAYHANDRLEYYSYNSIARQYSRILYEVTALRPNGGRP